MKRFKVGRRCASFVIPVGLLALVMVVAWAGAVYAQGLGVSIKIDAKNKSNQDTPSFCPGAGGGEVGDRLKAKVFTDHSGVTTGTATFTSASGVVTTFNIDQVFGFFAGIALADTSTGNVIPIWLGDDYSPIHVNVELPQGCVNTVSTFTSGVDKVVVQIKGK